MAKTFGFYNLHYNDHSAQSLAHALRFQFGVEAALRYAKKEFIRTDGETLCSLSDLVNQGAVKAKVSAYVANNATTSNNNKKKLILPEITTTNNVKDCRAMIEERCAQDREKSWSRRP